MAYEKQSFLDGEELCAEQLNHMEEGIFYADQKAEKKAEIDDTAVGPDAWSSKHLIDRLCPAFDENGGCVVCEPVAGYPLEVISKIAAAQAGSGDPSPDNVRPITVHKALTLTQCGKNLYDAVTYPLTGKYYVSCAAGTLHKSEKYSATAKNKDEPYYIPVGHLAGYTITLNHPAGGGNPGMAFYDSEKVFISGGKGEAIPVPENAMYMLFCVDAGTTDVQIELGSAVTEYEPYRGKTLTIDLPEGAAAGTYDWNTGSLTVTHKAIDMSTLEWSDENDGSGFLWASLEDAATLDGAAGDKAACSLFCKADDGFSDIISGSRSGSQWSIGDYGETRCVALCCETTGDDLQAFMDLLENTNAVLVYPLSEQYTVQFDPQQVLALDGVNIIYSDTGDTVVAGLADPRALTASLMERLAALEKAAVNNT